VQRKGTVEKSSKRGIHTGKRMKGKGMKKNQKVCAYATRLNTKIKNTISRREP